MADQQVLTGAANALTLQWAGTLNGNENTVLSGTGAWCVLAALLAAADGPAAIEMEAATGIDRASAADAVESLLSTIARSEGSRVGMGLWTAVDVVLDPEFQANLPSITVDNLPKDPNVLDRWAHDMSGGIIDHFPPGINADTRLAITSVIAVDVAWAAVFESGIGMQWAQESRRYPCLWRQTRVLDDAALITLNGITISRAVVESTGTLDVHLVAGGPSDGAAEVLSTAIQALDPSSEATIRLGSQLQLGDRGGCLEVSLRNGWDQQTYVSLGLPAFTLNSSHDLLERVELFGLASATDQSHGHFPKLAAEPLAINQAGQDAAATFSATGFQAAAITLGGIVAGGLPPHQNLEIDVQHDRPFGLLAVDRVSGLVLFAGWVAEPPRIPHDLVLEFA